MFAIEYLPIGWVLELFGQEQASEIQSGLIADRVSFLDDVIKSSDCLAVTWRQTCSLRKDLC